MDDRSPPGSVTGVYGGPAAVVNDWITDVAIIEEFTGVANVFDTTFQK